MSEDEVKRSLRELHEKQDRQTDKLSEFEISIIKQELASETYIKQSDRMAEELRKMNDNLAVYNAELKVHIAGVLELKEQNRLMKEEIKQRDVMINERLDIAEKPIKWATTTATYLKWSAGIITALTTIGAVVAKLLGLV
jgi:hypothetical protein